MTEQQSGLRFDIYERVHLHEGFAEIRELNDVELAPHIQVITQGEQAVLQGNLLLTGNYASDAGEESRSLEHLIPVEITLPLNRIHRLEDILVEIENFDVNLLSPRSLNVTGVLSLQGVEVVSQNVDWREEEEFTFVHETDSGRSEALPAEQPVTAPITPAVFEPPADVYSTISDEAQVIHPSEPAEEFQLQTEIMEIKAAPNAYGDISVSEDKKELKLAFGKKAEEAAEVKPYGIKSLLSKAGSLLQTDRRKEEQAQDLAEESKLDSVEWKKLFLHKGNEEQEFRKVRICIVQREETLDTIAKRYQVNPRELQLFNRLSDPDIAPGQIIYLPR